MDTEYSLLPMKKEMTDEQVAKIASVKLHDLAPKKQSNDQANKSFPPFDSDEEIPF
jgi:hypothetical protein